MFERSARKQKTASEASSQRAKRSGIHYQTSHILLDLKNQKFQDWGTFFDFQVFVILFDPKKNENLIIFLFYKHASLWFFREFNFKLIT